MTITVNSTDVKIYVSQEDNDTKDFNVVQTGTKLTFTLGDINKEVDLANLIPQELADRFLSKATYDIETKELVLTTSKKGEEDVVLRVPFNISQIGIEVEEIFTKEQNVTFSPYFYRNGIRVNGVDTVTASALGRIKGTDWYVLKFNSNEVSEFKEKLDIELSKRLIQASDFSFQNPDIVEAYNENDSVTIQLNDRLFYLNNLDKIQKNVIPSRLNIYINGTRYTMYPNSTLSSEDRITYKLNEIISFVPDADIVQVKLEVPFANYTDKSLVILEKELNVTDLINTTLNKTKVKLTEDYINNQYSYSVSVPLCNDFMPSNIYIYLNKPLINFEYENILIKVPNGLVIGKLNQYPDNNLKTLISTYDTSSAITNEFKKPDGERPNQLHIYAEYEDGTEKLLINLPVNYEHCTELEENEE